MEFLVEIIGDTIRSVRLVGAIDRATRPMNGQPGQRATEKGVTGGVCRMTSRSDGKDSVDDGRKYRSTGIRFHLCLCRTKNGHLPRSNVQRINVPRCMCICM